MQDKLYLIINIIHHQIYKTIIYVPCHYLGCMVLGPNHIQDFNCLLLSYLSLIQPYPYKHSFLVSLNYSILCFFNPRELFVILNTFSFIAHEVPQNYPIVESPSFFIHHLLIIYVLIQNFP